MGRGGKIDIFVLSQINISNNGGRGGSFNMFVEEIFKYIKEDGKGGKEEIGLPFNTKNCKEGGKLSIIVKCESTQYNCFKVFGKEFIIFILLL